MEETTETRAGTVKRGWYELIKGFWVENQFW